MTWEITGVLWYWRGPAPWFFVTVPDEESVDLRAAAAALSYGWGMVPVTATVGATTWTTSLWPQEERYVVPVKADVRRAEGLAEGDVVTVRLSV
ncbi:hypothetical protein GCM10009616_07280 [Microlunatus lacustris]